MIFSARIVLVPLMLAGAMIGAESTGGLAKTSPFKSPASAGVAVEAAGERIEFSGVSTVGKKTEYIFYDKVAKKSHWVGSGETKEGISVVSYDERREQATVKINGVEKILPLRKGTGAQGAPRPVAALPPAAGFATPTAQPYIQKIQPPPPESTPTASAQPALPAVQQPPQPTTPEGQAQAKAETEARMLVSDLLEIGMAQRKAYEEAQRKAAEGTATAQPNAPTSSAPAQPNPTKPTGN